MSFAQIVPGFINQVQPPVLPVSKVKTEAPMVIKNEPPECEMMEIGVDNILDSSESEEKIISDIKDIDIVWHPLYGDSIKSQPVTEDIHETKHLEVVETQVYVKAENSSCVNIENIIQSENLIIKTEETSDGNGSWGTGQGLVEVLGSHEHFNASGNLETEEQLVLNFSRDLNGISTKSRKANYPENIDFVHCYKTVETTSWEKDKEKIKVIKAPVVPIEPHEYTSLAKDKYVCNHCQHTCKRLANLRRHIKRIHRKVTTMYKCPYCPHKSKWSLQGHIIRKHKDTNDIQWFQCHLCEMKFKLKYHLTRHVKVHLTYKQIQEILEPCLVCGKSSRKVYEKRYCKKCYKTKTQTDNPHLQYHCDKCNYKGYKLQYLNAHKMIHSKPKKIEYFYCYHCTFKSKYKDNLKTHISTHFRKRDVPFHCYICDFVTQRRDMIIEHLKKHPKHHSILDETKYKIQLETLKNREKRYHCNKCDYKTDRCSSLKNHRLIHLKPGEIRYFHCYHCSYKSKRKDYLVRHICLHFEREDVSFHCYICDFMTPKRDLIVEHFKKHPEHHSKCDETILETHTKKLEKRHCCDKCNYKTSVRRDFNMHKIFHLKPEEIEYFYCYHCSYKSKRKYYLKTHILKHFEKGQIKFHCYICDFLTLKRDVIVKHFEKHSKHHSQCDETKY